MQPEFELPAVDGIVTADQIRSGGVDPTVAGGPKYTRQNRCPLSSYNVTNPYDQGDRIMPRQVTVGLELFALNCLL